MAPGRGPLNRRKYGNRKTVYKGITFDSVGECDCYKFYELKQRAGEIRELTTQPKVYLTDARILYKPDLSFINVKTDELVFVDYKGVRSPVFAIKKRLWVHYGVGRLILCEGYGLNIKTTEIVVPFSTFGGLYGFRKKN